MSARLQGVAVAWFRREDWPRWRAIDAGIQPDYDHWLTRMEEVFARYQAAGVHVVRMILDPDEFVAWSQANGRGVGTDERAHFAALMAAQGNLH